MHPIAGVDVDQDRPNLTGRELGDRPFSTIGRPDTDTLAFFQAQCHEPAGAAIDLPLKLAIGITQPLVRHDQGLVVGVLGDNHIEHVADGDTQQRGITDAADVARNSARQSYSSDLADLCIPETIDEMIVDHTDGLHEGIADGGADEREAAPLQVFA